MNLQSSWLRRAACLALLPTMTGCLTTGIWTPVFHDRANHPAIAGVVRNYPARGDQAIIVTYRATGDWNDVNLVVPLDASLNAVSPFAPIGQPYVVVYPDASDPEPVAGRLTTNHLTAIFQTGASIGPDRPGLARHLNAVDYYPVASYDASRPNSDPAHPGTACMLAFKINDAGEIVPVSINWHQIKDGAIHLPTGTHLLMVPASVDRPHGDRAMNTVDAVLLTPVTVGADLAIIGAGTVMVLVAVPIALPFVLIEEAKQPKAQPYPTTIPTTLPAVPTLPVTVPVEIGPIHSSVAAAAKAERRSVLR
jgi:hypothetical protein